MSPPTGDDASRRTAEDERHGPAIVLVATDGDWTGRSLESVLVASGYAVLRASDGEDTLALARRYRPDALVLDEHLGAIGGIEVCRRLTANPEFDLATPIVITAPSPVQRAMRADAYDAGAWDFCTHPLEADTLLMKLATFLRARHVIGKARERSLIDEETGVLSPQSMERWAQQLAARASRNHESLACIVLMPSPGDTSSRHAPVENDGVTRAIASFLQLSRDAFRRSDVVGRTEDGRLALLAPQTDSGGVEGMLARLRAAIAEATAGQSSDFPWPTEFKAGYWAVQDFASAPLEPQELLRRAARALDYISNPSPHEKLAIGYDELPLT